MIGRLRVAILGTLAAMLLRILSCTWRFPTALTAQEERLLDLVASRPVIFIFWHSKQLYMPAWFKRLKRHNFRGTVSTLISRHADGRIIAHAVSLLGLSSVAGSSSRGGAVALRKLRAILEENNHVAITPDGPRGPVCKAKPGVLKLAQLSGACIVPVSADASKKWVFNSWDRMELPKPFAQMKLVIGEPLAAPEQFDEQRDYSYLELVEIALARVTKASAEQF